VDADAPQTPVEVWDDEHGYWLLAFGTHDAALATEALVRFAFENGIVLRDDPGHAWHEMAIPDWDRCAARYWADPAVREVAGLWPRESVSAEPKPGWIPFMVVDR